MFRSPSLVLNSNLVLLLHKVIYKVVLPKVLLCMLYSIQYSYHLHAYMCVCDSVPSKTLQVFHPLSLSLFFFSVLLKSPSLCRAQVPGPGQAEFRKCPSMNFSNTKFQMWANGWETWVGGASWPYTPSPLPRSLEQWAGSICTRGITWQELSV